MKPNIYLLYSIAFFFLFTLSAQNCNDAVHTGEGTYYDGVDGGVFGNCSLPVADGDHMHCALNNIDYDGSNACGACIEVTGPKGSVRLKVVDRCPECAEGDVDMTEQAFAMMADVIDGRVPISWKFVPCDSASNNESIKINFKEGSSIYWTAIQFRNIKHAIAKMEYQLSDNTWKPVDRVLFNFFIETDGIASPMNLRITSILGEELIFENIPINLNEDYNTGKQFTTPSECSETLSVDDIEVTKLSYYPNPSSEILYIINDAKNWILTDSNGKKIKKGNASFIDTSILKSGLYFLSVENKKAEKIIIK
ncbi:expansin EXLX1 family cellulose-binding protein [Aquimarina litoralis]|uniref:expansin EXLX1 family cellulose-binding protein n=1 Tax=Aquimarina litoralis TaxID=584605 RepID=UPI001C58296F|nr:expansin EXLX1 family cellulose-binding protein [Aquimarina litoralis]MBW1295578.1 T9SS type A sorting domain-containing protein [Aquimarina litoralis]